jgi:hypothetical protein
LLCEVMTLNQGIDIHLAADIPQGLMTRPCPQADEIPGVARRLYVFAPEYGQGQRYFSEPDEGNIDEH